METSVTVVDEIGFELSVEEVKKNIAPGATDKELFYFMNIAKTYGLNPFKREIYFVKFEGSPGQTMVGYEVYLKRAEKTGKLDGWDVHIEDMNKPTEKAVITIHRKDRTKPFTWEVFRNEFDQYRALWKTKPHFMLRKVAISQGFRLAFPDELGGIPYTSEEIGANALNFSDETILEETPVPDLLKSDPVQETTRLMQEISALKKELKIADPADWALLLMPFGVTSAKSLNELQLIEFKRKLEAMRPTQAAQAA